jgi:hypothetical protein
MSIRLWNGAWWSQCHHDIRQVSTQWSKIEKMFKNSKNFSQSITYDSEWNFKINIIQNSGNAVFWQFKIHYHTMVKMTFLCLIAFEYMLLFEFWMILILKFHSESYVIDCEKFLEFLNIFSILDHCVLTCLMSWWHCDHHAPFHSLMDIRIKPWQNLRWEEFFVYIFKVC